jgi:hypothetical protein
MPVINPHGLFEGQRLAACSDVAQLYWPRLFCAANGYARLELHYPTIAGRCFHGFRQVPTEDQVFAVVKEYADNFLVVPYHADGQLWVQFATEDKFLRRRKTADDERSPAPPPASLDTFKAGYAAWKAKRQSTSSSGGNGTFSKLFPTYFQKASDEFSPGVGVGVGVGDGVGDGDGEPSALALSVEGARAVHEAPTVFDLPLIGKKVYGVPRKLHDEFRDAYPGVSVMAELGRMRAWLLANPTKMKTANGIPRFINSWLANAQNEGGRSGTSNPSGGTGSNRGAAVGRVERSINAFRRAAEESGDYATGSSVGADSGFLPAPRGERGDGSGLSQRVQASGNALWDRPDADRDAATPIAARPEILPPPQRSIGGA